MIKGIGIDIADQTRMQAGIDQFGGKFIRQMLTETEISSCTHYRFPLEHYTGKFAVKEAFMKALGTGLREIAFHEVEVFNRDSGAPYVVTSGKAATLLANLGVTNVQISLSHDAELAVAVVILEA